ncbi:DUF3987 domain-containing protein [Duganella fentianensis]|uniref:DUF3987 domain-containing protein n=1 Tax=Duganella fentianensis TaxID=2692177 RepID=UPI0032B2116A
MEKIKMRQAAQASSDSVAQDSAPDQDAANDSSVSENTGVKHMPVVNKEKKKKTMKELVAEHSANKARRALVLAKIKQQEQQEDEPIDGEEDDSEPLDTDDEDDNQPLTQHADAESVEVAQPPALATSVVLNKKKSYPVHAFGSLTAIIMLIAKAVQVDLEMVGSALLGVVSALAQSLINVSSRQTDSGCPVTINMFVIAASGERKSSTIDMIIKPVYAAISRADDARSSMIIQDVTVDGMVVGLIERCPAQFLLALEGASLLGGHAMSRDNLSRFLGNVASLFSGEPLTRTRVEEHHYAQGRRLSVLLFCQPIVAMDFLSSGMVMQQGMGNRFLYSQPPSLLGTRKHVDVELDTEPLYQEFCAKITALATHAWKINPETGGMDTRTVRMSPGAKAAWVEFYNKLEMEAGPGGDLATHAGYVTRFAEQVMRIAALLAILEDKNVQDISEDIMLRAIDLGDYYLNTAMHVFNVTPANKDEADAKTLLEWMQNKSEELDLAAIPVRMMYKDGPRCARPSKRTKELLTLLEARGEVSQYTEVVIYGDQKRSCDNYAVTAL